MDGDIEVNGNSSGGGCLVVVIVLALCFIALLAAVGDKTTTTTTTNTANILSGNALFSGNDVQVNILSVVNNGRVLANDQATTTTTAGDRSTIIDAGGGKLCWDKYSAQYTYAACSQDAQP